MLQWILGLFWRALGCARPWPADQITAARAAARLMAITFHGAGTLVDATSGSTLGPIPLPAGAAAGDFVIVGAVAHGSHTLTCSAGWTSFPSAGLANADLSSNFFWRRLDGTTGDNIPTITSSGSFSTTNSAGARTRSYLGVLSSGTPYDDDATVGPTSNDTPTSGAVTTVGADRLIVSMVGMANDAVVVDGDWSTLPAAGWTLDGVVDNWNYDGDGTFLGVSKAAASAGTVAAAAIGTYISTVTFWRSFTVALTPEPTGPSAPTDPTSVVATTASTEATVTWVDGTGDPEPTWDTEHRVDGGSWTTSASDIAQGVQTRTQTGLTNGTLVRFRVRGQNTEGDSAWVESNDVTVGSIPLEILDATSSGNNTAGNPQNVAYPAHLVGDLIVQCIAIDANVTATVPTTGPNGETITAITTNVNPGAAGPRFSAWWWIATGAETAGNISVTLSAAEQASSESFRVPAGSFDAADPIPDISANGTQTSGTGTTITMPSFTATVAGGLVVAMGGVDADPMDATFSPAGWTDVITHDVGAVSSFVAQRDALTTTSETISAASFGINTGDTASVVGFVIAPAPAEAGPVEGTAALTYGGTLAATGTALRLGTAAASYGGTVTADGTPTRLGTAALAYGGTLTATGTIPTSDVTGTVALTYGGAVAASGIVIRSGTAALDYGGAAAVTGQATRLGTAALSYGGTVSVDGSVWGDFPAAIQATGETDLWAGASGDIADDPWIWRNPSDPAASFILGVSKSSGSDGGVYTFDLDGTQVAKWLAVTVNGVDGRDLSLYPGVDTDWDGRVLVLATDRTNDQLRFGFLASDGTITSAGSTNLSFEPYGCTLYVSPVDGAVYAFVSEATGGGDALRQHELTITGDTVTSTQVRSLDTASLAEGMACYDSGELFFLGEEDAGLYVYDAEPDGGTSRTAVDTVAGNLTADVEGVTVVEPIGGQPGYIIASSQGASDFQIYELAPPHDYLATFEITAGTFESVDDCDGLHAHRADFGSAYPNGILVTHDATNPTASNYKISDLGDLFGPIPAPEAGTAVLAYGGTLAATGTVTRSGAAALDYGGLVSATAARVVVGAAVASYGGTLAADGVVVHLGTAAASYGGSVAASGTSVPVGGGVIDYGGTVTATGQVTRLGTAALAYGGSVAASGVIPTGAVLGVVSLTYGGTVTADGVARRAGTAAASYGGTVTADAIAVRLGAAALSYGGSVSAVGTVPVDQGTGTAALDYGGTVVGLGHVRRAGVAVVAYGGATAALGIVTHLGTSALSYGGAVVVLVDPEGTHPVVRDSSGRVVSTVMATTDGQTVIVLRDGSTVRRYEHPGWLVWSGDPGTLIEV